MKPSRLFLRSVALTAVGAAIITSTFTGCSKKSETVEQAGGGLIDTEIAKRIPAGSTGFMVWDSSTETARNFKQSAWGTMGSSSMLEALRKIDSTPEAAPLKPFLNALTKTGILPTEPGQPDVVRAGVGFIDPGSGPSHKPSLGLFVEGNAGQNLREKLKVFEDTFAQEGYSPVKRQGSPEGFFIPLKPAAPGAPDLGQITFVASEDKLAIVTDESNIQRLFGTPTDNGMQAIAASEQFKQTLATLPGANQLSAAFLDIKATLKGLSTSLPQGGTSELQMIVDNVPVESLAWSHRFQNGIRDTTVARIVPQDDKQKLWMTALSGGSKHETLNQVPADALFTLSLDAAALARLRDAAVQEGLASDLAPYQEQLSALDSLTTLTVAIRGASQVSPFPEVLLAASGKDASKTFTTLKGVVDGMLASFGMQLGDWQTKDLNGTPMNFLMSPLGVGAFSAQSGNTVLVASSEPALSDGLAAGKDAAKSLRGVAGYGAGGLLGDAASTLYLYLNFERTADMVKSMQGSLAMFTGGQAALPDETMNDLRKLGSASASFSFRDNMMRIESRYDAPTKQ